MCEAVRNMGLEEIMSRTAILRSPMLHLVESCSANTKSRTPFIASAFPLLSLLGFADPWEVWSLFGLVRYGVKKYWSYTISSSTVLLVI